MTTTTDERVLTFHRLGRVWAAGERCVAANDIFYATVWQRTGKAVEVESGRRGRVLSVSDAGVLLVQWDGLAYGLSCPTSPDSVDPLPS